MRLLMTETSPYVRKVRIVLREKGMACEEIVSSPYGPTARVAEHNPLGKIPVLLLDTGEAIYDSPVICQYLEWETPTPRLVPGDPRQRFEVLRYEALADGIADSAVAIFLERKRDAAKQDETVIAGHETKIRRGLESLGRAVAEKAFLVGDSFSLADAAVLSALAYVRFRIPALMADTPAALAKYEASFAERASVRETAPPRA